MKLNVLWKKHVTYSFSIDIKTKEKKESKIIESKDETKWRKRNDLIDVKVKVDIRSENLQQTTSKKQKTKDKKQKRAISEDCWLEMIWKKKKKKKKKWEKKWDYIDEKMSDWNAERKVSDWGAKSYGAARDDRKNVVSMRGNCGEKTRDWLRAAGLYGEERGHMISITSMMKNLMMNLIIWLMILSIW